MQKAALGSKGRPIEERLLDDTDIRFLVLITSGYSNSFAIYRHMKTSTGLLSHKKAHKRKIMAYKNANRRILLLAQAGLIEEQKYTERTPHGRIDYKLTMKGAEALLPYMLSVPSIVEDLAQYFAYSGLDIKVITESIVSRINPFLDSVNKYLSFLGDEALPLSKKGTANLELASSELEELKTTISKLIRIKTSMTTKPTTKEMSKPVTHH